jgi:hypothetical protein
MHVGAECTSTFQDSRQEGVFEVKQLLTFYTDDWYFTTFYNWYHDIPIPQRHFMLKVTFVKQSRQLFYAAGHQVPSFTFHEDPMTLRQFCIRFGMDAFTALVVRSPTLHAHIAGRSPPECFLASDMCR